MKSSRVISNLSFVLLALLCLGSFADSVFGRTDSQTETSDVVSALGKDPKKKNLRKPATAKPNEEEKAKERTKTVQTKMEQGRQEQDYGDTRFFRYKTNFLIGVHVLKGSSLLIGGQIGYAPVTGMPFYIGPEASFSLFPTGSLLTFALGGWYEFRIYGAPRLSLNLGAVGGPAFSSLPDTSALVAAAFVDACIVQEVNDLASIRGQFRPGFIGGNFAFMMNFNVSFRFL